MAKHRLFSHFILVFCSIWLSLAADRAFAQDSLDEAESLFSKEENEPLVELEDDLPEQKASDIKQISDLGKLIEFKDIAVIQKRYLPKTGRFEAFAGGLVTLNDVFFLSMGLNGRLGYYFRERYGVEFVAMMLNTSERQVTTDLQNELGIQAQSFITPKSYLGLDFKWTPIYGKMTWLNRRITPFDLYFSFGGGSTATNQGTSAPTVHLGTGQIFALSKSMAFRWDFSWNFFSAKSTVTGTESNFNNLILTVGMSFFFPEATYR